MDTTEKLQLSMVGGKFIRRDWSKPVDGVAVSLSLDSDIYNVGDEVPLHIAVGNFDSRKMIAVTEHRLLWAKGNVAVSVELQGPGGPRVIRFGWIDRYCRRYLMPGLRYPVEVPLGGQSFSPGIYHAVAVWNPSRNGNCGEDGDPRPADHFTVTSRPVVFRIIEPRHPGVLAEPGGAANK